MNNTQVLKHHTNQLLTLAQRARVLLFCLFAALSVGCTNQAETTEIADTETTNTIATLIYTSNTHLVDTYQNSQKGFFAKNNITDAFEDDTASEKTAVGIASMPVQDILSQKNTLTVVMPAHSLTLTKDLIAALNAFKKEQGIDVALYELGDSDNALLTELQHLEKKSPVDVVILNAMQGISDEQLHQLFQPVVSSSLNKSLQQHFRANDNYWYGIGVTPMVLVSTNADKNSFSASNYQSLANTSLKGKLCLTKRHNAVNQAIIAHEIKKHGTEKTLSMVNQLVTNTQGRLFDTEPALLNALVQNQCQLGMVSYAHYLQFIEKEKPLPSANDNITTRKQIQYHAFSPKSNTPVTVSGAAVSLYAPNALKSLTFIEWLATEDAQLTINASRHSLPVINSLLSASSLKTLQQRKLQALSTQENSYTKAKKRKNKPVKKKPTNKDTNKLKNTGLEDNNTQTQLQQDSAILKQFGVKKTKELTPEQVPVYLKLLRKNHALSTLSKLPLPHTASYVMSVDQENLEKARKLMQTAKYF